MGRFDQRVAAARISAWVWCGVVMSVAAACSVGVEQDAQGPAGLGPTSAPFATAVSSESSSDEDGGSADEPLPTAPASASGDEAPEPDSAVELRDLLQWIPLSAFDNGSVEFVSFTGAAQAHGLARPSCDAGHDAAVDFLFELGDLDPSGVTVPRSWTRVFDDAADFERSFGLRFCDLYGWADWIGETGHTTVMRSSADLADIERAAMADAIWAPLLEERTTQGLNYWWWGDGLNLTIGGQSAARGSGQAGTLGAVRGGLFVRAWDDASHTASVAAGLGEFGLLRSRDLNSLATVLQNDSAYRVSITGVFDERRLATDWIAWGNTFDGGFGTTLVLTFGSDAAASDALERFADNLSQESSFLGVRWADRIQIEESQARGHLAIFRLRSTASDVASPSPLLALAIQSEDPLFNFDSLANE